MHDLILNNKHNIVAQCNLLKIKLNISSFCYMLPDVYKWQMSNPHLVEVAGLRTLRWPPNIAPSSSEREMCQAFSLCALQASAGLQRCQSRDREEFYRPSGKAPGGSWESLALIMGTWECTIIINTNATEVSMNSPGLTCLKSKHCPNHSHNF